MNTELQKQEIDNLRILSEAKELVLEVVDAIKENTKIKPTLSEAIMLMGNHYLSHLNSLNSQARTV